MNAVHYVRIDTLAVQPVVHMDSLDHENLAIELYFSRRFPDQLAAACIYPTRLQRASQGAGQSAAGCSYDVVERRCIRGEVLWRHTVVLSDLRMDAERDGAIFARYMSLANGAPAAHHLDARRIHDIAHGTPTYFVRKSASFVTVTRGTKLPTSKKLCRCESARSPPWVVIGLGG
jgi:hypothetical protein